MPPVDAHIRHRTRGEAAREAVAARTALGRQHEGRGRRHLALELIKTVDAPANLYFERGEGPYLYDADGNRYIDMLMGFGVHLLGHRLPEVEEAVRAQLARGWHFGLNNTLQGELAEEIADLSLGQEKVLFCGSGSEATFYGCRVARAFTGRTRVAVFDGSYHGSHDYALVKAAPGSPRERPTPTLLGSGVPESIRDETMLVLPFRDPNAFQLIREYGRDLAAVLVQPVQNNLPRLDSGWFLQGLREACDEVGALLFFDEVVTGLRISLRGAQGHFGVRPDLTAYGKAFGGGLPVGALAGRADVMELFPRSNDQGGVFSSGTFNANPLTVAAGLATVRHLRSHEALVYPGLDAAGRALSEDVNTFAEERQMNVRLHQAGSMLYLAFQRRPMESSRDQEPVGKQVLDDFFMHMLAEGVLMPGQRMILLSAAHTAADVAHVAAAVRHSLACLREDGLL